MTEKFWARVQKGEESDCWLWTGGNNGNEPTYGRMPLGNRKSMDAHRYSYQIHHGTIPDGLVVRHKCDVTLCVNPHHLELGTQGQNMEDMVRRGRSLRAQNHPRAKLTDAQVAEARKLKGIETAKSIAQRFGVARSTILAIWCGQNYAPEPPKRPYRGWEYVKRFRSRTV